MLYDGAVDIIGSIVPNFVAMHLQEIIKYLKGEIK